MVVSILGIFYLARRRAIECLQLSSKGIRPMLTRTSPLSPHSQVSGSHHCSW